jgi:hypothetical protein
LHSNVTNINDISVDIAQEAKECINSIKKGSGGDNRLIRLIGDELADRGSNDYFTLLLLDKMNDLQLNYEIIWSNHGQFFIEYYQEDQTLTSKSREHIEHILKPQAHSLIKLMELTQRYEYIKNEVKTMVEKSYKPYLKAMTYTEEADTHLTLYTHAVAGPKEIEILARELNAKYDDSTISALKETIDDINKKFRENFVNQGRVVDFPGEDRDDTFIWRRFSNVPNSNRPHKYNGYTLSYVHGHDKEDARKEHIHNLDKDNTLGYPFKDKADPTIIRIVMRPYMMLYIADTDQHHQHHQHNRNNQTTLNARQETQQVQSQANQTSSQSVKIRIKVAPTGSEASSSSNSEKGNKATGINSKSKTIKKKKKSSEK